MKSDASDTSRASAQTAATSPTPQDAPDATTATADTSAAYSPQGFGMTSQGCFQSSALADTEYWLTQRGWEATMDLPPLTRRNNGTPSQTPAPQLGAGTAEGRRGAGQGRGEAAALRLGGQG